MTALRRAFEGQFHGHLVWPDDGDYDAARRVWNGAIDLRPRLIARCSGAANVRSAVALGRAHDLLVAVRGGGHNVAGLAVCDDGLVIDLSAMNGVWVDPQRRLARVQAGATWGELDRETQAFDLATTGGIVTHTGVSGLTLGGGLGWLMRKHGLTIDNLLAADVVTADGAFVRASADENPDLFWGLRGGGGNFGVVTSFEFQLHPVGPLVLAGPLVYPLDRAREVLRFYRDFVDCAPEELTTILTLRRAPPLPGVPEAVHGTPVLVVNSCYAGAIDAGERVLRPLRNFGQPVADLIAVKPYVAHQAMLDATVPHGWHYYWKSSNVPRLTDAAIDVLLAGSAALTSPRSYCIVFHLGGAVSHVAEDASAYSHRGLAFNVNINAVWVADDPAQDAHVRWARDLWSALQPHAPGGVYMNFLGDEGQERVREAYGAVKYQRLVKLKDRFDPTNFFRRNQNVPPSTRRL